MPFLPEQQHKFTCAVAAVAVQQTFALYRIPVGVRIRWLSWRTVVSAAAASTATWDIGDNTLATYYVNAATAVQVVGTAIDGSVLGAIYSTLNTINVIYRPHAAAGVTAPTIEVSIIVQEEWPTTS